MPWIVSGLGIAVLLFKETKINNMEEIASTGGNLHEQWRSDWHLFSLEKIICFGQTNVTFF